MLTILPHFKTFYTQLKGIDSILSNDWYRDRLRKTCLAGTEFEDALKHWTTGVITWRWGCITRFLKALLPQQGLLTTYWDPKKFNFGTHKSNTQQPSTNTDADNPDERWTKDSLKSAGRAIQLATSAIRSKVFWAYCHMILLLSSTLELCSGWSEGCECHDTVRSEAPTYWKRVKRMKENLLHICPECPFKARRAVELATGYLETQFKDLSH